MNAAYPENPAPSDAKTYGAHPLAKTLSYEKAISIVEGSSEAASVASADSSALDQFDDDEESVQAEPDSLEEMTDDQITILLGICATPSAGGESLNKARAHLATLTPKLQSVCIRACIVIVNNPKDVFLIGKRGEEKTASGTFVSSDKQSHEVTTKINAVICSTLPKKTKEDIAREESTASKEGESAHERLMDGRKMLRKAGPGWLNVNFSCCKMIALDYLDSKLIPMALKGNISTMTPLEYKFHNRFLEEFTKLEEVPYSKKPAKDVSKTLVIQRELIHKFVAAKRSVGR